MTIFPRYKGYAEVDVTDYGESDVVEDTSNPTSDPASEHLLNAIWDRRVKMASDLQSTDSMANQYRAEFLNIVRGIKERLVNLYGASNVGTFFCDEDLPSNFTFNNESISKILCLNLLVKMKLVKDMGIRNGEHHYSLLEENWID